MVVVFFFSSRRRHTRCGRDWSSDVCSSDLGPSVPQTKVAYPAPPPLGSMERPIPASELLKKRSAPLPPSAAAVTHFGLSVLAGSRRGERFRLPALIVIGSRHGNLVFSDDPFLSPQHATLTVRNGRLHLRDDSSASGVFASI